MPTDTATPTTDDAWTGGFVCGLLTARYYTLRHTMADDFFTSAAAPTETPEVVGALITQMCRAYIDERLFETSWASLDHLLLCESADELKNALAFVHDRNLQ